MPFSILGFGGGMLISALTNAVVSTRNTNKNIEANAELQQLNREFQEAQQEKQWKNAEEIQRKMREMQRQNLRDQIEFQTKEANLQALESRWPLPAISPRLVINGFNEYIENGKPIPLQLILVENGSLSKAPLAISSQVRNAINELNKFMSTNYGLNSRYAVRTYDTDKKDANFGSAEVHTVYEAFKVAPTVVLTIRVHNAEYVQECWFWGSGLVEEPEMIEIFRCNVDELQLAILKKVADDWAETKKRFPDVSDPDCDSLSDLIRRIELNVENFRKQSATPQVIQKHGYGPFREELAGFTTHGKNKKINSAPFIQAINKGIEQCILSSFKICAALLSDVHFLLEYKTAPRFLQICSKELQSMPFKIESETIDKFFKKTIDSLPDYQKSLMLARLASSYQQANRSDKATEYGEESVSILKSIVKNPQDFSVEANDEMLQCLKELTQIPNVSRKSPWIDAQINSKEIQQLVEIGDNYFEGKNGYSLDYKKAFEHYRQAAARNYHWGYFNVGKCYLEGQGAPKNDEEARKWFRKAVNVADNPWAWYWLAEMGDAEAALRVSDFYASGCHAGIGMPQDDGKAADFRNRANRLAEALYIEGDNYYNGQNGYEQNDYKAFDCYMRSAAGGHFWGYYNVGKCYHEGRGVSKNDNEALKWFKKSKEVNPDNVWNLMELAELGDAVSMCELGDYYYHGWAWLQGLPCNHVKAFHWYLKSAEGGYHWGCHNVGECYLKGKGVPKNDEEARKWFRKAIDVGDNPWSWYWLAEMGDAEAALRVSDFYASGCHADIGMPQDDGKAQHFREIANR